MSEFDFHLPREIRKPWIRYREPAEQPREAPLRAGVAGAYLPPVLLELEHKSQARVSRSVPHAVSMALQHDAAKAGVAARAWMTAEWLAEILGSDASGAAPGKRLERLRAWGVQVQFPGDLQFFRDGTAQLSGRLGLQGKRLVYRWEEPWLRAMRDALRGGVPPVLFVDLGRLYPRWRGLPQPHAVVLAGGDGRQALIHDPAREDGPTRVGLGTLMDALLPGEPLAVFLRMRREG